MDFSIELRIISKILFEFAGKLLVYIKKKTENNYYILLCFGALLPVIYFFLSVFNIVDYNLYLRILSPILPI